MVPIADNRPFTKYILSSFYSVSFSLDFPFPILLTRSSWFSLRLFVDWFVGVPVSSSLLFLSTFVTIISVSPVWSSHFHRLSHFFFFFFVHTFYVMGRGERYILPNDVVESSDGGRKLSTKIGVDISDFKSDFSELSSFPLFFPSLHWGYVSVFPLLFILSLWHSYFLWLAGPSPQHFYFSTNSYSTNFPCRGFLGPSWSSEGHAGRRYRGIPSLRWNGPQRPQGVRSLSVSLRERLIHVRQYCRRLSRRQENFKGSFRLTYLPRYVSRDEHKYQLFRCG